MTKEKFVLCDIDDVIVDTHRYLIKILLRFYGNPGNLSPAEIYRKYHGRLMKYWSSAGAKRLIKAVTGENSWQVRLPFIVNAAQVLARIAACVPILYATARSEMLREGTLNAFIKGGVRVGELVMRDPTIAYEGGNAAKAAYILSRAEEIAVVIDDNAVLPALLLPQFLGHVIVFNPPHDYVPVHERALVCHNWSEVHTTLVQLGIITS